MNRGWDCREPGPGGRAPKVGRGAGYGAFAWAGAFLVLAGCTQLGPAERQLLIHASELYSRNETSSAMAGLDRLIRDFGQAVEIGEAYYVRGLCRTRKGELAAASEDFVQAIGKSKRDDLAARSEASLAAIRYRRGDWAGAAKWYAKAVPHLPDRPPTDEVLYYAGIALQRTGKWREAALQFGRILQKFRHRPVAADARRQAGWRHGYYAIQVGAFRNAGNAEKAGQSFRTRGLSCVQVENHPRDGGALWVVMAGRYPTYRAAVAALPGVRAVEAGAYIIPRP